jgi:hypothetical protein
MYGLPMTFGMVPNLGSDVATLEHAIMVLAVVCLALMGVLLVGVPLATRRRASTPVAMKSVARDVSLPKAA